MCRHSAVYWPEEDCFPHVNTESAIKFIGEARSDPFFLHVSYFDPHPPYMAPAKYVTRYDASDIVLRSGSKPAALGNRLDQFAQAMGYQHLGREDLIETMRYYYAQVEWGVDQPVGRLLGALESKGLAENTIVVLTADHGDFMGDYGMVRKGMFLYDSLLHVPLLWWAPGRIAASVRTDALAQSSDLFPTLAELTGGSHPEAASGISLADTLLQKASATGRQEIYTSAAYGDLAPGVLPPDLAPRDKEASPRHSRVLGPTMDPAHRTKMVRSHEWKFILNETEPPELYRLSGTTPRERENVAGSREHLAVRQDMERRLNAWWSW